MSRDNLTSMLNRLRRDRREDSFTELTHFVWDTAYRYAEKRLGEELRGRVSATDIVNSAMRSAFSAVEKSPSKIPNRQYFEALVKTILSRHIKDTARWEGAIKRSVKQESGVPAEEVAYDKAASDPSVKADAKEKAVRLAEILLQESKEERRLAVVLGVIAGYKAGEICEVLKGSICTDEKHGWAPRTIDLWLKRARERVKKELGLDLDE